MTPFFTHDILILIKGAGDLATGVAARLHRCGFPVVMTELPEPLMVRRAVAFGEAVYEGETAVEGIVARRVPDVASARAAASSGVIAILVDPATACRPALRPDVEVDAIMAKRNTGTTLADAPLVVAGPGFTAPKDCHAVIETNRGHWLGRAIWNGSAEPDTGVAGEIAGRRNERVLRAPVTGELAAVARIGERVSAGQVLARVDGHDVCAGIDGVLRGMLHPGLQVTAGVKVGDVDPRAEPIHCTTISEKSLAIGGGVLEAILSWQTRDR